MKKKLGVLIVMILAFAMMVSCQKKIEDVKAVEKTEMKPLLSTELFNVTVPSRFEGLYDTEVNDHSIDFFDKECKSAGNPGWIFGIQVFENPSDWAYGPVEKIGELKLNSGKLYDVVISYPTESQFGFSADGKEVEMPAKYKNFYDARYEIIGTVHGKNGEQVDVGAGTKGERLYKDELNKHLTAIKEQWDASKLEEENMSPMYAAMGSGEGNVLDKVGYAYRDINNDGIEELLIGEIAEGDWKGIIYDIYTMVDRKPAHVISGWDRNRYFDWDDNFIINEYSNGADESGTILYVLGGNTTELVFQLAFKYDGYSDETNPWFESYSLENGEIAWSATSEASFNEKQNRYLKHLDPVYKAFSTIK